MGGDNTPTRGSTALVFGPKKHWEVDVVTGRNASVCPSVRLSLSVCVCSTIFCFFSVGEKEREGREGGKGRQGRESQKEGERDIKSFSVFLFFSFLYLFSVFPNHPLFLFHSSFIARCQRAATQRNKTSSQFRGTHSFRSKKDPALKQLKTRSSARQSYTNTHHNRWPSIPRKTRMGPCTRGLPKRLARRPAHPHSRSHQSPPSTTGPSGSPRTPRFNTKRPLLNRTLRLASFVSLFIITLGEPADQAHETLSF